MKSPASRRSFLAAGLALPAAASLKVPETNPALTPSSAPAAPQPATAAPPAVAYRTLGKTGLKITSFGMGCALASDASMISRAIDMGVNHLDTARMYRGGNNERMVGNCLRGAVRGKVILASKAWVKDPAEARSQLDTSLKELGTDYLDIWYLQACDEPAAISDELVAVWVDAKKQGKIRFIGISTHKPNAIVDRVLETGKFDVMLSTYNFAVGTGNDAAFARLHEAGIGLVAMKTMAPTLPPKVDFGFTPKDRTKVPGGALASLKWVLRNPKFACAITGMRDMEQLEENFRAMTEPFGERDEKLLAVLDRRIRPYYCRMCGQCTGQCPQGAAIPESIRYLSYNDFYGDFAFGREHFTALPEAARSVRCSDCESCQVTCPNGVQVVERLTRAQELFG